ncbi:tRNA (adenosine(37)-N6)-threonylcarbamoyltransferase complex transferase subunit TsaD [Candidatus Gottesmanbacteria bacterium]|nr:tRNA (adenosine(37)-N6)-threonylcarbamoyltransferase complex transferase subunit TsaD [Candidatus Gottesmanbacteria bacterium]
MKILAIESSCDETAAAVIEDGVKILSTVVSSSEDLHREIGGIIPETAARQQLHSILPVIEKVIAPFSISSPTAKKNPSKLIEEIQRNIDGIAVTIGPGLIGSLLVGVETAKTLAYSTGKSLIPVNHISAHLYANWLDRKKIPEFPAIGLVVSGGHTELFFLKNHREWKWLGGTRDDAAGETFDKTARLLELGYPGGPAIAAEAEKLTTLDSQLSIKLPRPMFDSKDFQFSFSGLKTAVIRKVQELQSTNQWDEQIVIQLAHEIQESITDVLVKKTLDAVKKYAVKSILLGGGVAANRRLSEKFNLQISSRFNREKSKINLHVPPPSLCTDNAAYIGSFAYFCGKPASLSEVNAEPNLELEV